MSRTSHQPREILATDSGRRLTALALSLVLLCSCRASHRQQQAYAPPPSLPPAGWGQPMAPQPQLVDSQGNPLPLPYEPQGNWAPPGIVRPWPRDEYLHDGGVTNFGAEVDPDWRTTGIDPTDTVLHYDTIDGQTLVQPSNRVHLYAPRFGAVRSIARIADSKQYDQLVKASVPEGPVQFDERTPVLSGQQRESPIGQESARLVSAYGTRQHNGAYMISLRPYGFQDNLLPYENFTIVRNGIFEDTEKARLAKSVDAAITWSTDQGVRVLIDEVKAAPMVKIEQPEIVFTAADLTGCPKVRVIKMASTQMAKPGDTVDFTIRFDNIGDQVVGNLVLIDNLTTRLEYVADSAQSSVKAQFRHEPNHEGSLVLRWEVEDQLKPGDGGVVRFQCRVR